MPYDTFPSNPRVIVIMSILHSRLVTIYLSAFLLWTIVGQRGIQHNFFSHEYFAQLPTWNILYPVVSPQPVVIWSESTSICQDIVIVSSTAKAIQRRYLFNLQFDTHVRAHRLVLQYSTFGLLIKVSFISQRHTSFPATSIVTTRNWLYSLLLRDSSPLHSFLFFTCFPSLLGSLFSSFLARFPYFGLVIS